MAERENKTPAAPIALAMGLLVKESTIGWRHFVTAQADWLAASKKARALETCLALCS